MLKKIWDSTGMIIFLILILITAYEIAVNGQQPSNGRVLLILLLAIQQKPCNNKS